VFNRLSVSAAGRRIFDPDSAAIKSDCGSCGAEQRFLEELLNLLSVFVSCRLASQLPFQHQKRSELQHEKKSEASI
jgi:hypothetical protein